MKKFLVPCLVVTTAAAVIAQTNALPIPFRVDCGNTAAFTDAAGNVWNDDTCSVGGSTVNRVTDAGTDFTVTGVTNKDTIVFQTERYSVTNYAFYNVPNGAYTVILCFCETYATPLYSGGLTGTGQRVFNVSINGSSVLSNFDVWATAGNAFTAVYEPFNVTVTGDSINIAFTAVTQNVEINGIEILKGTTKALPSNGVHGRTLQQVKYGSIVNLAPGKAISLLGRVVSSDASRLPAGLYLQDNVNAPRLLNFK